MPKLSAGLLVYRIDSDAVLNIMIVHPGGPFWLKKDAGAWSVPKGEYMDTDDPFECATREFEEELGQPAPQGEYMDLGEIRQPSGKRVHCWAVCAEIDVSNIVSNEFEMEWPRGSGKLKSFPEVDRADWFSDPMARRKLVKGQVGFIDRLVKELERSGVRLMTPNDDESGTEQASLF